MQPLIAIPAQWSTGQEEDGDASSCRRHYLDSIIAADGLPLIVPLGLSENGWNSIYNLADGIFLTGGCDVDPYLYGEAPHPKLGKTIKARDEMESWFVKQAFEDNKPLLGICRGIQIMNVALGGSLYQDIPDQLPSKLSHSSGSAGETDKWQCLSHSIEIDPESKLFSILEVQSLQVNSLHHQAVQRISEKLKVTARSPDGLIEAAESDHKKFFIGIQSHPEALWQNQNKVWLNLFKSFVAACRN